VSSEEIREEAYFKHKKEDEQLDEDDEPQSATHSHAAESISIKVPNAN